jgi:5'-methylthioadenosine phosphorylase
MSPRTSIPIGVIAGTGIVENFHLPGRLIVETEFGDVTVQHSTGRSFYLLPRHGPGHEIPPHRVNYRANISALHKLGVKSVIATGAVGSMNPKLRVGGLGLASQFIDFTRGRQCTLFDSVVRHTDMTEPYSRRLGDAISTSAAQMGLKLARGLVYVCVDGPRFETAAEIKMFRLLGGDVVGMTGVPEAVLAREMEMEYASILVATNWAAGIQKKVSHAEVLEAMRKNGAKVKSLIMASIDRLGTS